MRWAADVAASKPPWSAHRIWDLVSHLTAELNYARAVIEGTAGPWIAGETTWPAITDTSDAVWQTALNDIGPALQRWKSMSDVGWFAWDKLPQPLFLPFQNLLEGKCYPRP